MSYRCQLCRMAVQSKRPLIRHTDYRPDGNILRETPVCQNCKQALEGGQTVRQLLSRRQEVRQTIVERDDPPPPVVKPKVVQAVEL